MPPFSELIEPGVSITANPAMLRLKRIADTLNVDPAIFFGPSDDRLTLDQSDGRIEAFTDTGEVTRFVTAVMRIKCPETRQKIQEMVRLLAR